MLLSLVVVVALLVPTLTLVMALDMAKRFKVVTVEPVDTVTLTLRLFLVHTTLQSVAVEQQESMVVQLQLQEMQQLVLA
jgi:hypothetical protein